MAPPSMPSGVDVPAGGQEPEGFCPPISFPSHAPNREWPARAASPRERDAPVPQTSACCAVPRTLLHVSKPCGSPGDPSAIAR